MLHELDNHEIAELIVGMNKRGYQLHGEAVFDTSEEAYLDEDEADELLESVLLLLD